MVREEAIAIVSWHPEWVVSFSGPWPEVTKRFSDTHKRTKVERRSDRRRATRVFSSHCRLGARKKESPPPHAATVSPPPLSVKDAAGREQRLAVAGPCNLGESDCWVRHIDRALPAQPFEGRSVENIDRCDVVVADREPFSVGSESKADRAMSARRRDPGLFSTTRRPGSGSWA
jgi:hypothetical protein